ncbi:MAG TPA: trehalose-phosphatase [Streptosporangiaceae bacterium]|nr:trehalose-phosphatase [Streptosporangiaceae bacterium]
MPDAKVPGQANGQVPGGRLPVPRTAAGKAGLAALIASPGQSLIAVDFDGTLAPIIEDPAAARATPAATAALLRLAERAGTVAIITGRPAADAASFAGVSATPRVLVLGHYGRQRWERGRLSSPDPPPGLSTARTELPAVLAAAGADVGTFVEDKGEAVAVHTRRAAEPQAELDRLRGPLAGLAERTGLALEPGRLVLELRPPGADKGGAITSLAAERAPSAILFCGDDLGDRPAFAAVRALRDRGTPGLLVCSGSAEVPELADEADLVVDGPDGVAALLAGLAEAFAESGASARPG